MTATGEHSGSGAGAVVVCGGCQQSFAEFQQSGLLGCPICYSHFAAKLYPLLERFRRRSSSAANALATRPLKPPPPADRRAHARLEILVELLSNHHTTAPQSPIELNHDRRRALFESCLAHFSSPQPLLRLRLARNLSGISYIGRLSAEERTCIADYLLSPQGPLPELVTGGRLWHLTDSEIAALHAARLLSKSVERAVLIESIAADHDQPRLRIAWSGEEDHLRLALFLPYPIGRDYSGLNELNELARRLNRLLPWQFHPTYGYLAACPGNSGAAQRLSVALELPQLIASPQWSGYAASLERLALVGRGPAGEESGEVQSADDLRRIAGEAGRLQISSRYWPCDRPIKEELAKIEAIAGRLSEKEWQIGHKDDSLKMP